MGEGQIKRCEHQSIDQCEKGDGHKEPGQQFGLKRIGAIDEKKNASNYDAQCRRQENERKKPVRCILHFPTYNTLWI
jgi:hypothetical protein